MRVPFIKPSFPSPAEWVPNLKRSYRAGRFSNFGPVHQRFEAALGRRYARAGREAVLVSSGTAGLTAVLLALGIRGRVAIPAFTFPATAQAVLLAGCVPAFCDVDPDTWEMNEEHLRTVSSRVRLAAIMPVRAFGFARDLSWAKRCGRTFRVPVVIDSAAGLGGTLVDGEPVGNQGDAEVFSLHVTKPFGIGEGGVVFCASALASRVRRVINFSLSHDDVISRGLNGKMSEMSAAVGLAVLHRINRFIANRRTYVRRYQEGLAGATAERKIQLPVAAGRFPAQCFPLKFNGDARAAQRLIGRAREEGVELRRYYFPALHLTRAFRRYAQGRLPVTEALAGRIVCLPVHSVMEERMVGRVVQVLNENL